MNPESMKLTGLLSGRPAMPEAFTEREWDEIVGLALRQDVAPALHAELKARAMSVPAAADALLREAYLGNAARTMRLLHERDRVLAALKAANVCVVPVKGASLAEQLYNDAGLRPMGDIDLWVRRPDVPAARAAMEPLGYSEIANPDRPPALQDALMGETQMVGPGGTLVELHWSIFSGEWLRHTAQVDQDAAWTRTMPVDGDAVRQLSPEDTVVHLCVHLAVNHQMSGIALRTLVDLERARRKWTIDWTLVAQRAREWRVACATWVVLDALAELFGNPAGDLPLAALAPGLVRRQLLHRIASPGEVASGLELSSGPRRFLFLLLLVDRSQDAALLAWRALWPDRLWLTRRYGAEGASEWTIGALRARHLWHMATRMEV